MDCNPPSSSIHGIFQARVLEWGAIALSEDNVHGNAIPIKIPRTSFHRTRTNNLKICMETQKTQNLEKDTVLRKHRAWGILLPDLKLYYEVTGIRTVWYWHKKKPTDQCICIHSMECYLAIRNMNLVICNSIGGPWGYYAMWNKSDGERQTLYEITYIWTIKI